MAPEAGGAERHVFGPVPSRRLGRSLGVDLVPYKVCSLDCVYCQVGRTTDKTLDQRDFVPVDVLVDEVVALLRGCPRPDYITLAGSGEPTLYRDLGILIDRLHAATDVPVAVLTNGTLFWKPEVREACARADLVLPSLDAGDAETFERINRPADGLTFDRLMAGLIAFRKAFDGEIWLEVFLVRGLNDAPEQIERIADQAARIRPDRIQLNTAVRPTADPEVAALDAAALESVAERFTPRAEVIADFKPKSAEGGLSVKPEELLDMIRRRPVTADDIAEGKGLSKQEVAEHLRALLDRGMIVHEPRGDRVFYRARS